VNADSPANTYALLTSPGPAGIALFALCGPRVAKLLADNVELHTQRPLGVGQIRRARLRDVDGAVLDDIVLSVHATAPQWSVRLHLHGQPRLVARVQALLEASGFADAPPDAGDLWVLRDALEGRIMDALPAFPTRAGMEWVLSQGNALRGVLRQIANAPEPAPELQRVCQAAAERRCIATWFQEPSVIVLAGPPNAGKSTLANALADAAVAVVADIPGTTRDWVEVPGELGGYPVVWNDTAGIRDSSDTLEAAGVERTRQRIAAAAGTVVVLDGTDLQSIDSDQFGDQLPLAVAVNKTDRLGDTVPTLDRLPPDWRPLAVPISAQTGAGLNHLRERVLVGLGRAAVKLDAPAAMDDALEALFRDVAAGTDWPALRQRCAALVGTRVVRSR
jgi:small GTP-binding protein